MQVLAGLEDLLPLIVLLALSSWFNYQKKKKEEAEAKRLEEEARRRAAGGQPGAPAAPRPEVRQAPPHRRPEPVAVAEEEEEDWDGEDRDGEHGERWDDRKASEARSPEVRGGESRSAEKREQVEPMYKHREAPHRPKDVHRELPADRRDDGRAREGRPAEPSVPQAAKEKAQEKTRDLLTQIAKDLGLELPVPPPRPAPKPAAPPPAAKAPAPPPRAQGPTPDEIRARLAESGRQRPGSLSATRPAGSLAPVGAQSSPPLVASADLAAPEALRRAFVLKTVLERPLARRPPGPARHRG